MLIEGRGRHADTSRYPVQFVDSYTEMRHEGTLRDSKKTANKAPCEWNKAREAGKNLRKDVNRGLLRYRGGLRRLLQIPRMKLKHPVYESIKRAARMSFTKE